MDSEVFWQQTDCDIVSRCMRRKVVDVYWNFNVARNPHAGGNWERAIRSVKYVFYAILNNGMTGLPALKTRYPTDFELLFIMSEIEVILNCRPITKLTSDIKDWRALTPMSELTGNLHRTLS